MPEQPTITPEELAKALEKDGFVLKRVKGSHHTYYHHLKDSIAGPSSSYERIFIIRPASLIHV
jgi:predicted RNA binding protein YcfA (HicA-like mRNA interferase family)